MIGLKRLALLKHGAPPRNVLETALRAKWGGGGTSYEKTVGPAPIISIADAKAKPAKSLTVGMEPIQDLHGYDSPWPAGGGKNKLNTTMTTVTRSGVTFTPNNDGTITTSGTSTNSISDITFANNIDVLPNTNYILTGCPSGGSSSTYRLNLLINGSQAVLDYGSGAAFTTPEQITSLRVYPIVLADVNMDGKVYQPMIRLATETDATYASYENLCPISGRTGVTVERTGVNLLSDGTTHKSGNTFFVGASSESDYPFFLKAGTYTASNAGTASYMYWQLKGTSINNVIHNGSTTVGTFTLSQDGWYRFWFYTVDADASYTNIQIELGSTASDYDPYVGESYPVTFPNTVYGGTVDLVTGVLTVTHAKRPINTEWAWTKSTSYPGGFYYTMASLGYKLNTPFICTHARSVSSISDYVGGTCYCDGSLNFRLMPTDGSASVDDWKSYIDAQSLAGNPIEICYELATPQTYQLTPQQIQMLKGANVLWSDGDDLTLTYIGTTPPNLLGGMLGGGYTPPEEEPEEEEQVPEEEQAEKSDPEEVEPDGES